MPSPTSMTVPTSVTDSFCSKPAISCFNTLVISATFIAIAFSALMFVLPRGGREQLPLHRFQLILHAGIDQLVIHAHHDAADDFFIDVLVDDRIFPQRLADALTDLF